MRNRVRVVSETRVGLVGKNDGDERFARRTTLGCFYVHGLVAFLALLGVGCDTVIAHDRCEVFVAATAEAATTSLDFDLRVVSCCGEWCRVVMDDPMEVSELDAYVRRNCACRNAVVCPSCSD